MELIIRFEYGKEVPWVRKAERGILAVAGPNALCLDTHVDVVGRDMLSEACFTVAPGDRVPFVLSWHHSHLEPPDVMDVEAALTATVAFWDDWCSTIDEVHGEWEAQSRRSLITLKA